MSLHATDFKNSKQGNSTRALSVNDIEFSLCRWCLCWLGKQRPFSICSRFSGDGFTLDKWFPETLFSTAMCVTQCMSMFWWCSVMLCTCCLKSKLSKTIFLPLSGVTTTDEEAEGVGPCVLDAPCWCVSRSYPFSTLWTTLMAKSFPYSSIFL